MVQLQRQSPNSENAWLSMLVETMDRLSRPEFRASRCDPRVVAAARLHLARPRLPARYASAYSLRN